MAAYLGIGHIEAGNTVADFQAEQFKSRHLDEEYFGVEQCELEYFEMAEDRASVAGSNPSLLSNRPILEAKPSSRRSSPSTLALLRSAAPPIDICQPGPACTSIQDQFPPSLLFRPQRQKLRSQRTTPESGPSHVWFAVTGNYSNDQNASNDPPLILAFTTESGFYATFISDPAFTSVL